MLKNFAVAALLGLVSAAEVEQKNENGEEFPIIVLSRHAPIAPVMEVAPVQDHSGAFISKMVPNPRNIIAIEAIPIQQPQYHHSQVGGQPMHHSQTDTSAQAGVKVTNVRTYDDPNFATKETTSKCADGTCMIKECIGGNCKEFQEKQQGPSKPKSHEASDMISHPYEDQHPGAPMHISDREMQAAAREIKAAASRLKKPEIMSNQYEEEDVAPGQFTKEQMKSAKKQIISAVNKQKKKQQPSTEKLVKDAIDKLNANNQVTIEKFDKQNDDPANHLHVPKKGQLQSELHQSNSTANATANVTANATTNASANATNSANTTKQSLAQDANLAESAKKESTDNEKKPSQDKESKDNLKNLNKMTPTKGAIELNQSSTETDEELDAEVYAGDKSKEVADIEKAQHKIMMMQQQVLEEQKKVEQKMQTMLAHKK